MASFELGGAVIPLESGDGTIKQTYAPKHEGTLLLMGDGGTVKQSLSGALDKLKSSISSGSKWAAATLSALDYSAPLLLKCAELRSVHSVSNVVTITSKRRTEAGYLPIGYGVVDGRMFLSDILINVNEITITPVPGASYYMVTYFPQITVFATFKEDMDAGIANYGFSLECEEV